MTQRQHIRKITELDQKGLTAPELPAHRISQVKARTGSCLYVVRTHPEAAFEISYVGSKAKAGAEKTLIAETNKMIRRLHEHEEDGLHFRKVADSWSQIVLVIFSDAGWATRASKKSQAGAYIFWHTKRS